MVKLIEDINCPNCKKPFTKETDLDKLDKTEPVKPTNTTLVTSEGGQQLIKEPKVIEKEVIKTVIEDFKPNYECPDGNCDIGVHKNKNFKKRPKGKCSNCDQFTKHDKGTCPWCKKDEIEALDPEELDNLDFPNPPETEIEHNHE